ncbi:hypothetical protein BC833DRAFT_562275 [Globomyces pollinis-pini]|nr:hypothetical protein BC833DRAFT_562275 [Globomyces pollinis-pini]
MHIQSANINYIGSIHRSIQIPAVTIPSTWPTSDQTKHISSNFLTDPLVVNAYEYVKTMVPSTLLSIPPSKHIIDNQVIYTGDKWKACYSPATGCTRNDSQYFKADISTCPQQNDWGLTYDDGPTVEEKGFSTVNIKNELKLKDIRATFFVIGANIIRNPQLLIELYNDKHQIGLHTWTHHPLTTLKNEEIVAEIKYTEALIYKNLGVIPTFLRPPYGDIDDRVRAIVSALGYRNVLWTDPAPLRDSKDGAQQSTSTKSLQSMIKTIQSWFYPQKGFISLQHDVNNFTSYIAVKVLQSISTTNFPLKPQPVGSCLGLPEAQWYRSNSNIIVSQPPPTTTMGHSANYTSSSMANIYVGYLGLLTILFTFI